MKSVVFCLWILFFVSCKTSDSAVEVKIDPQIQKWNDSVAILSGKNIPLKFKDSEAVQRHQKLMLPEWEALEMRRGELIRTWASQNLKGKYPVSVLYPFSGPDLYYSRNLFQEGKYFILFGLEASGEIPDFEKLTESELQSYLSQVRNSLSSSVNKTFFETKFMKVQLASNVKGTLPAVLTWIGVLDGKVLSLEQGGISTNGEFVVENYDLEGYKIKVEFEKTGTVTIEYYGLNVLDKVKSSALQRREAKLFQPENTICFFKSASYLMHYEKYAEPRDWLLNVCGKVLQDDTGFTFKVLKEKYQHIELFGNYREVIPLFKNRIQPDLKKEYAKEKREALPFGIGYKFRSNYSNLQFASKDPILEGSRNQTISK